MNPIENKLFSFHQRIQRIPNSFTGWGFENAEYETVWKSIDATVNKIRASDGFEVTSFRMLINEVAKVTLWNRNFEMFYRGQSRDYKNNQTEFDKNRKPKTIIYPSICRPNIKPDGSLKHSLPKSLLLKRYNKLFDTVKAFKIRMRNELDEYYFAQFQHYDILPTPLIDITQSLRVAATFALRDNDTSGYVYVFGLPYPNQSISYFLDLKIILIKLQNVVPIDALRPRYQEGFLVGKYPIEPNKTNNDDLANRLVAKFKINNSNGTFWDEHFTKMPTEVLFPENDQTEVLLNKIKSEIKDAF